MYGEWCGCGFPPDQFWRQTPSSYSAALDGYSKRREYDHKLALIEARSQAIWTRCEPRKIPTVKSILAGKSSKPAQSDLNANARAWIVTLKHMNKGA